MRLSEFENEDALELMADIIEPVAKVLGDEELRKLRKQEGVTRAKLASVAIKNHKKEVIEILAALNGVKPEEYHGNPLTISVDLINILNDNEVQELFFSQAQNME